MIDKKSIETAVSTIFSTEVGKNILTAVERTVSEFGMLSQIKKGVVVGFSGGADSVMLLVIMAHLSKRYGFSLVSFHVNHCIRGAEANSDEEFAKSFSQVLGVPFYSVSIDVPMLSRDLGLGVEETARNARYDAFSAFIKENPSYVAIATAHNSTDNLETMIFNMMRGAGSGGMCGIAPIRDNVIRPLISVSKQDICRALEEVGIPYVTDSTNASVEYTRNYIRHEIIPLLRRLSPSPEASAFRVAKNIREDKDFIKNIALEFINVNDSQGKIAAEKIISLHPSPRAQVISLMISRFTKRSAEAVHINKICELLTRGGDFTVDVPGKSSFVSRGGECFIEEKKKEYKHGMIPEPIKLDYGINILPEFDAAVLISKNKNDDFSSNVYKISIQARISSDIILGSLYVRAKTDGDSYKYGGMTHKVKRLFSDKKIPLSERSKTPIFYDEKGIIWIPGFPVRDGNKDGNEYLWITVYKK